MLLDIQLDGYGNPEWSQNFIYDYIIQTQFSVHLNDFNILQNFLKSLSQETNVTYDSPQEEFFGE